ncbi:MAG: ABC transporter substrate-binding protein [Lachnospirales bacterium]
MKFNKKKIIIAAISLTLLSSCGTDTSSTSNTEDQSVATETENTAAIAEETETPDEVSFLNPTDPLTFGYMSSIDNLPFIYADEFDLYEQYSVNFELIPFFAANERDMAYLGGELDGIACDLLAMASYYKSEKPAIIAGSNTSNFSLAVNSNSGIESIEDLEDKVILYSKNTVIDYTIDKMLEIANLPIDSVTKEAVPSMPLRVEMLLAGEADAALMPDPFATTARVGGSNIIFESQDYNIGVTGFGFEKEFLSENQELAYGVLSAYNAAVEELNKMTDDEFTEYIFSKFDYSEDLKGELPRYDFKASSLPEIEQFDDAFLWAQTHDLIETIPTYEEATLAEN